MNMRGSKIKSREVRQINDKSYNNTMNPIRAKYYSLTYKNHQKPQPLNNESITGCSTINADLPHSTTKAV